MIQVDAARKAQLSYIGLSDEDLSLLRSYRDLFYSITNTVVDELYSRVMQVPCLAEIIGEHSTIDRLKETQRWYFRTMVEGVIDAEFIERRIAIGKVHSRIGLTTDWYLGTYMLYLDIASSKLRSAEQEKWPHLVFALSKMFNFDSQLVLEAYEQDEKAKIQRMADERHTMLETINAAVQDLAKMMVELNNSSTAVSETAEQTAELQESSNRKVQGLYTQIQEIDEMGSMMREMSDQTHLIGLNAAIEAARAGESGRGFEVVANEIRKLASRSRDSLETIQAKLSEISSILDDVKKYSEQTTKYSRDQAESSKELASFVSMIETVTQELEAVNEAAVSTRHN
ncbi:globin-coupled sensor protein [Paenibacillus sp. y28]|uniref:globin-coupled sensor protein n=1 Tax=Paenibacillus sp. y28 TaxID=3129110 RepID=UPI00301B5F64